MKPEDLSEDERRQFGAEFVSHLPFCRESIQIRNHSQKSVPFEQMPGQLRLNEKIQEQRKKGKPIRLVILKTRRSMFTAGVCGQMFREVPFFAGRKGLVIADKYKPAGLEAFGYLLHFQRTYKPFTRFGAGLRMPRLIRDSQQQLEWENGAKIDVLSAEGGEVRGGGRHFVLCDEVAFWRNADLTLTGVLNMVPYASDTTVVIQSTANGIGGPFYEMVQAAKDPSNIGGWSFPFFGWLDHPLYSMPQTLDEALKIQKTMNRREQLLHERHGATMEQLAWRRKTIAIECRGDEKLFDQEYPTTEEDAFLASGRPVFDHVALGRMPISEGQSGELEEAQNGPRRETQFMVGDRGALSIWQRPKPGRLYVIGADPSKGIDVSSDTRGNNPDFSAAFVIDQDTGDQVALLRARIRPGMFAEYLALLGRWYNFAYLVPEANDAGFIDALVRTQYPIESIYHRQRDPTDKRPPTMDEIGFMTTTLTRSWLVTAADEAIRTMGIAIRSPICASECRTFVIKPNGKAEHQDNCHDDTVIAMALAAIGLRTAPKREMAFINREQNQYGRRIGKVGDRLNRDDDDDDDIPRGRGIRRW